MKRVLVTGGSGFVGRHAIRALLGRGFEVHATTRRAGGAWDPRVTCHSADLLDGAQTESVIRHVRPTHLLHLAWYAVPALFWHAVENAAWVAATASLVDAAIAHGVRRLVGAGTCAEYEWTDGVCDEVATPIRPATPYGSAKAAAAAALLARAAELPEGCAWGRVFFLYGPHEHPSRLVASILRSVLSGEPALVTEGWQRRDFLYVSDAGAAFASLIDSGIGGAVNVSSGEAIAVRDLAMRAAAAAGRPDLLRLGATQSRSDEPPLIVGPPGRLAHVGWRPRVSIDEGLALAADSWRRCEP